MGLGFRSYSFSFSQAQLEAHLQPLGFSLKAPKELAQAILKLSDFYQKGTRTSPWSEPWAQAGYLSYFLPLNGARLKAVFEEGRRFDFYKNIQSVWDFGAGPGTASLAWAQCQLPSLDWLNIEPAREARKFGQALSQQSHWSETAPGKSTNRANDKTSDKQSGTRMSVFSYVLNELAALPDWAYASEALVLVEPSTQTHARALQRLRPTLIANGYSLWAPCPHHEECPLLHSAKDWCHDRVAFEKPDWFGKIEEHLPMRNQTVTFSYLLARKSPRPVKGLARLVGDQLKEKGKTRQLVCRGRQKQTLSWLNRHGEPPEISRGALVKLECGHEASQAEIRLSPENSTELQVIGNLDVFKIPKP